MLSGGKVTTGRSSFSGRSVDWPRLIDYFVALLV